MFDTVICLSSSSSSSELITISSHALSCSKDRIQSLCSCNLFAWFGKPFTFDSLFKQKELCRLRLTFVAKSSSSIDSLALVLSLDTLFQPVVIAFRCVSKGLLKASRPNPPRIADILSDVSSYDPSSPYTQRCQCRSKPREEPICGSMRA